MRKRRPPKHDPPHITFDVRVPKGVVVAVGKGQRLVTGDGCKRGAGRPLIVTMVDHDRGEITLDTWPPE